jgi:lipocalin
MKYIIKKFILSLLMISFGCSSSKNMIDNSTVKELDIERYLGTWYEIARYDHRFERDMVGVTAHYSWREDGKIKVINSGYKNSFEGAKDTAIGKAKIPDINNPAHLKVSFFWIFYGDYFVMELDENYKWAVIGSSSDKYLWILSRTPQISEEIKSNLLNRIKKRGYNTDQLIWVEQKP